VTVVSRPMYTFVVASHQWRHSH